MVVGVGIYVKMYLIVLMSFTRSNIFFEAFSFLFRIPRWRRRLPPGRVSAKRQRQRARGGHAAQQKPAQLVR